MSQVLSQVSGFVCSLSKMALQAPGGGGLLLQILDGGVPQRFLNPNAIKGLRKQKLMHPIQGKPKLLIA